MVVMVGGREADIELFLLPTERFEVVSIDEDRIESLPFMSALH